MASRRASEVLELRRTEKWWFQDTGLRKMYFLLLIAILSSATNGYDGLMMNGLQALTFWKHYFNNPHGSQQGLLNALHILIGSLIVALGAGLQSGADANGMFIAGRFFIGFGSGINGIASPLLITELAHPSQRDKITAIYNTFYYFGSAISVWTIYGTLQIQSNWSCRLPSVLQVAPSALLEETLVILAKYQANGNQQDEVNQFEYAEIRAAIKQEKDNSRVRYLDLIKKPGNRRRLFICMCCGLFSLLSGTGLTGYYLSKILLDVGITDPDFQNKLNRIIGMTNWLEASIFTLLVDRCARRPLFLISDCGMTCTFATWIAMTAEQQRTGSASIRRYMICIIFFHNFFYNLCWVSLNVTYPIEILPYRIRANGIMVQSLATNLALFFGQHIHPIGIDNAGGHIYFLY